MLPSTEDPFPIVQQEVRAAWFALSSDNRSLPSIERERRIQALELDLADLSEAIRIARQDRIRFDISEQELRSREAFVAEIRSNLNSLTGPSQLLDNTRRNHHSSANDAFIGDEMRQQHLIMDQQDEQLDHLASAVERIGVMGRDMHIELEEQGEMLDDLGEEMHDTTSRMKRVRQNLDRFIEEAGPRQFCTIVSLSATFLLLTFLVVFT